MSILPWGARLEPLGHAGAPSPPPSESGPLSEDRDCLQQSLFALTTTLAQIQFRLRQIALAQPEDKEEMLKALEHFAFGAAEKAIRIPMEDRDKLVTLVKQQHDEQKELLNNLKSQLEHLRRFDEDGVKSAINQLSSQLRVKDELEIQFKTQIDDLERYINHLNSQRTHVQVNKKNLSLKQVLSGTITKLVEFLSFLVLINWKPLSRFWDCSSHKTRHWGDLRARLELAVIQVQNSIKNPEKCKRIVRNQLTKSIQVLIEHGTKTKQLIPWIKCNNLASDPKILHCWDVILEYYNLKGGNKFNKTASQTLARSYGFDLFRSNSTTRTIKTTEKPKNLLCIIDMIIAHHRFISSKDSMFKALICAGLNSNTLSTWLNLVFQCDRLVANLYQPWSYVVETRYLDGLNSLDVLSAYKFNLPNDLDRKCDHCQDMFI